MAIEHAESGQLIDLFAVNGAGPGSVALVRDEHFEIFRLDMEPGKALPEHDVPSLVTIQCLRGSVELKAHGQTQKMRAGFLVYLAGGEPHALKALERSLVLVTMLVRRE